MDKAQAVFLRDSLTAAFLRDSGEEERWTIHADYELTGAHFDGCEEPSIQWWIVESPSRPGVWCVFEHHLEECETLVYVNEDLFFSTEG